MKKNINICQKAPFLINSKCNNKIYNKIKFNREALNKEIHILMNKN